ncbi:30S ribosomal protein S9 [bacterium]|nr:30S ribosomal protein S9 [bacterium]
MEQKLLMDYYATGHRKTATAKVWLIPEAGGKIIINDKPLEEFIGGRTVLGMVIKQPLVLTNTLEKFGVVAKVEGSGISAQVAAVRHGIARALLKVNPSFRAPLKDAGLLTRDPRVKERKKYGRHRARRGFQYSKR